LTVGHPSHHETTARQRGYAGVGLGIAGVSVDPKFGPGPAISSSNLPRVIPENDAFNVDQLIRTGIAIRGICVNNLPIAVRCSGNLIASRRTRIVDGVVSRSTSQCVIIV
jgi:hypothetical protein